MKHIIAHIVSFFLGVAVSAAGFTTFSLKSTLKQTRVHRPALPHSLLETLKDRREDHREVHKEIPTALENETIGGKEVTTLNLLQIKGKFLHLKIHLDTICSPSGSIKIQTTILRS